MSCHDGFEHARACADFFSAYAHEPSTFERIAAVLAVAVVVGFCLAVVVGVIAAGVYIGELLNSHHWCEECERTSRLRDAVEPEPLSPAEYAEAIS